MEVRIITKVTEILGGRMFDDYDSYEASSNFDPTNFKPRNANCIGFEVTTLKYAKGEIDGVRVSGEKMLMFTRYFFGGEVLTEKEVERKNIDGSLNILLRNMKANCWHKVYHTSRGGYRPITDEVIL